MLFKAYVNTTRGVSSCEFRALSGKRQQLVPRRLQGTVERTVAVDIDLQPYADSVECDEDDGGVSITRNTQFAGIGILVAACLQRQRRADPDVASDSRAGYRNTV